MYVTRGEVSVGHENLSCIGHTSSIWSVGAT
jgi:hypothetical protein